MNVLSSLTNNKKGSKLLQEHVWNLRF